MNDGIQALRCVLNVSIHDVLCRRDFGAVLGVLSENLLRQFSQGDAYNVAMLIVRNAGHFHFELPAHEGDERIAKLFLPDVCCAIGILRRNRVFFNIRVHLANVALHLVKIEVLRLHRYSPFLM